MRVRVRYAKLGKVRFISAIDMGRIWERSLRRADLPIAYSEGFTPHPKVSFPDALTLGYASTGEYAELTFVGDFDIDRAMAALNAALPEGMDVLSAVEVPDGAPRLSKWLLVSAWDLDYGNVPGLTADRLSSAAREVLAAEQVIVGRDRKGQITDVDLRPAIIALNVGVSNAGGGVVRALIHHTEPPMRPQEIHLALVDRLERIAPDEASFQEPALVTRVAQGRESDNGVIEAISGDKVPAVPPARQKATT